MAREGEETLGAYAKRAWAYLVGTAAGRMWLAFLVAYGVVGPILLWTLVPDDTEPSFWVDFLRPALGGGPVVLVSFPLIVFVVNPLLERWRKRKTAAGGADEER